MTNRTMTTTIEAGKFLMLSRDSGGARPRTDHLRRSDADRARAVCRRASQRWTGTVTSLLLATASACVAIANAAAEGHMVAAPGEIGAQGPWAYTRLGNRNVMMDMAATPAAEEADIWLLVACDDNAQLSVALMHADRFPFHIGLSSSVELRSARLPRLSVAAKGFETSQIAIDPTMMRHVMPLLVEEDRLAVSITATDGAAHDYTFAMQPNDVALAPVWSRCLGS